MLKYVRRSDEKHVFGKRLPWTYSVESRINEQPGTQYRGWTNAPSSIAKCERSGVGIEDVRSIAMQVALRIDCLWVWIQQRVV